MEPRRLTDYRVIEETASDCVDDAGDVLFALHEAEAVGEGYRSDDVECKPVQPFSEINVAVWHP